ncbi:MAG: sugar phosphate nucleotidyltransferase [Candidatus Kapabacteria bacterium]|nr:sugar phosphate nucleotidyltransferase [Candidatus Kapabacteria bacterium]MCS7302720.1 sugar phosphate nucleotidyltransferase [Candidatus Kapabacteria bacterium]
MSTAALILAGGTGARLYPRSRQARPKQLIHLLGEGTLIQNTFARLAPLFEPADTYVVTTEELAPLVAEQLPAIDPRHIIVEPFRRNTTAALALSAVVLERQYGPDLVIAALPSDHLISNVREFHQALEAAIEIARRHDAIVTIGLVPTRAETAFGYIQVAEEPLPEAATATTYRVRVFAEKPDSATAERFVNAGDFLWNSGIFVFRLDVFWNELSTHLPEQAELFAELRHAHDPQAFPTLVENIYGRIRAISFDYGVLEKTTNVLCVLGTFEWSDLSSWDELWRLQKKDPRQNVLEGSIYPIDTKRCYVSAFTKVVALVDVEDLIVVDSEDVLLICRRGSSQRVAEVVDLFRRKGNSALL